MAEPLWTPDPACAGRSRMARFAERVGARTGRDLSRYDDLHRWSVEDPAAFWQAVWEFTGIIASRPPDAPVVDLDRFPGARWFPGARLNFAENLLRCRDTRPALISVLETGERRELSFADLYRQTAALAAHLRSLGVGQGDRVAGWLPNVPEAVIAMLAAASLGAVWSSCSPDFGVPGALDRFGQIEPKVLFAADGYVYNGRPIDTTSKMQEVARQIPSIATTVWVSLLDAVPPGAVRFDAITAGEDPPALTFEQRAFDDPLYVMYSSGTTGKPKCIVHGIGGTLIQHLKEHQLHCDLGPDDTLFFFTTCGWMMWNWLVSGLASEATLVLYDGSPFRPRPDALMTLAEREGITVFGASAKYLSALEKADRKPIETHDLKRMRMLLSTGSPLAPESFRYVYRSIKPDVHLASISGGTDLISCFVLGSPLLPVYEGEIQCAGLGMAVDVFDDDGQPLRGAKGELVCTRPFPSCPIGFWNDPDGRRFHEAYFARFPGVWAHGDFAEITEHGGYVIHGRSDAVLNPGGVRIGTAEIYAQVEQFEEIEEAICVGQQWEGDVRVVLFVVMRGGHRLDETLAARIREAIKTNVSPRHVPAKIIEVPEIPRTLSGKIVELAVRDVIHGREVANTSALANPGALEHFRNRPELAS
ncbi:MAG TPA: acetoacetate--CoA ligase [Pseudomonadales bacterium]